MYYLGISNDNGIVYEGMDTHHGQTVQPRPSMVPLRFSIDGNLAPIVSRYAPYPETLFREDSFDPISKIRRGRVFTMGPSQPAGWYLQPNPLLSSELIAVRLITYERNALNEIAAQPAPAHYPRVVLGREPFLTFWRIVSIEGSISETPVLTLKSRTSLGDLPELDLQKIPADLRPLLAGSLEKLEASINRFAPTDVVDRCREALAVIFSHACGDLKKDLMDAIRALVPAEVRNEDVQYNAGRIVARLHSRTKSAERAKGLREPSEEDANLAVKCLWFILAEKGWIVEAR